MALQDFEQSKAKKEILRIRNELLNFFSRATILDHVMFRMGALAALRSKAKGGSKYLTFLGFP